MLVNDAPIAVSAVKVIGVSTVNRVINAHSVESQDVVKTLMIYWYVISVMVVKVVPIA